MKYPKFFDITCLFIPVCIEKIRINVKNGDHRDFRVMYVFGFRVFVLYV